jgi:TPP-dependent pyruvate/acetoin dehydrogenase alpha subunit/transketolase C-terminal domain/subunit
MRLTRTLEERLVALYRQTKVVGGLFRSLGQEADAVGSCFALERRDVMSPLIRNLGAMLVKGATPVEVLKQYMAKADSPTRGRELNIHFGDVGDPAATRGFLGQISPLGDMVPVMAGVTLSFRLRGEDRVGLVYVGDGATSTGAFHEGINFAAVQRCPLVVVVENNGYAYSTPTSKQTLARQFVDKAAGYGVPGLRADGNDVLAVYDVTKQAVDHARAGHGVTLVELVTYRRKGHAEHDNQSYVPPGEIDRWAAENDPVDRYAARLTGEMGFAQAELDAVDARVRAEVDAATDEAEASGFPEPLDCLTGIYADPPSERPALVPRRGAGRRRRERARRGVGHVPARERRQGRVQGRGGERLVAEITYLEAIREALFEEMARDPEVFCLGEDIGAYGGAFKVTEGLLDRFGERRVIDTPISEIAIVGAAAGAAHMGMRPVVEMQFIDFIANAYDMLTNYVATARYRAFLPCPMVVRGPSGGYVRGGPFHSQNPEAGFVHTPGLKVVYPATAEDAKGLMKAAVRDDDCVLFFEHKYLYRRVKGVMPEGDHVVPIGKARVAREGADLSIITYAATVHKALDAARQLEPRTA